MSLFDRCDRTKKLELFDYFRMLMINRRNRVIYIRKRFVKLNYVKLKLKRNNFVRSKLIIDRKAYNLNRFRFNLFLKLFSVSLLHDLSFVILLR